MGAFCVTLCVILLVCGIIVVDYNTRWIGFGNNDPIACISRTEDGGRKLEIHVLGNSHSIDITDQINWLEKTEEELQGIAEWLKEYLGGFDE